MESYQPPFESDPDRHETGSVEDGKKKKKKTTRIPKSAGILPKLEANEAKDAEIKKDEPENTLEKLFAKEIDKEQAEDDDKTPLEIVEEVEAEVTHETPQEVIPPQIFESLEEEPEAHQPTLEGEFAEEGMIISRAEAPKAEVRQETPDTLVDTSTPETAAQEPPKSPDELSGPGTGGFETLPPDTSASTAETVPNEEQLAFMHRPAAESDARFEPAIDVSRRTEAAEPAITRAEHEREVHYARKRATSRGVLAGGVFGYWLGRRGRKAAEQEAAEAYELTRNQGKKIDRLEAEQAMAAERFRAMRQTQAELMNHTRAAEQTAPEHAAQTTPAQPEKAAPAFEKQPLKAEQLPEDQPVTEETYQTPAGRRVETSSWHRYEVDEKTGRIVENPELAYGEEFKKEQKQEKLQRPATEAHVAAQLGQAIVQGSDDDVRRSSQPADVGPAKAPQATKNRSLSVDKAYVKQQFVRHTTNPMTWVIAALLVVVLFAFGILG